MKNLCIGDCHFGIKTNSTGWLAQQLNFFEKQVIPTIKTQNFDNIIFLGDLFDIRYAINQQIGVEVKNLIRRISELFSGQIYFIAGNHDYYAPIEELKQYNVYRLLFDYEFMDDHKNVHFVDDDPVLLNDGSLLLPWYWTENPEHFDELLYNYKFNKDVKCIYCHTDLTTWPGARTGALNGVPVYSGHIHYIIEDPIANLYNLGAAFSLTYADVNQKRYVYIIENHKIIDKIENITSPQFKHIYNEDIFKVDDSFFDNSYVYISISESNSDKAKYIERLKYIKFNNETATLRIKVIDDEDASMHINMENGEGFNTNVEKYIDDNIPDYLSEKYKLVKSKIEELS